MTWYIFAGFAVVFGVIVIALLNYGKREVKAEINAKNAEKEELMRDIEQMKDETII